MTKKIILILVSLLLLISCEKQGLINQDETLPEKNFYDNYDPKTTLENVSVEMPIKKIILDCKQYLSFDLELERPDLNLKESDFEGENLYTVDLPTGLQPRLMYSSDPNETKFNYGSMCDRPRFPHRCDETIDPLGKEKTIKRLIKIVFEDNTYAEKIIEIPIPEKLPSPEIVFPTTAPDQNDKFKMSFKDIGADKYDISFHLCHEYENDGINPCLDGGEYQMVRENGNLKLIENPYSSTKPSQSIEKDIVTIETDRLLEFEESVVYEVVAYKDGKIGDNIPTLIISSSSISFQ